MAAAAATLAAPVAGRAEEAVVAEIRKATDDPLDYFIKVSRKVGVGLIGAGVVMGATGWYLKAAATSASNDAVNVMGNIGSIFSNIKPLTFSPAATGTAPVLGKDPLADVTNFAQDARQDLAAFGKDVAGIAGVMGTLAEDVALGLIDIAKAIVAFVMHFPQLLWDGLMWAVGGGLADIMNWLFPYLILFGVFLVALSLALSTARWAIGCTVAPAFRKAQAQACARGEAKVQRFFDILFRNRPVPEAHTPPNIEGVPATSEAQRTKPEGGGGEAPLPVRPPTEPAPEAAASVSPEPAAAPDIPAPAAETSTPTPPLESPTPVPERQTNGTTEQTEAILGGVPPPGWSEQDVQAYLKEAPEPVMPEPPEPLRGKALALRADELLA